MRPISRRTVQRGLTLLEVLVAIILLTTTLVSFASVYPAAFKLNRKSHQSVQAAKYATAVAEELRSMTIAGSDLVWKNGSQGRYLENFMDWRPGKYPHFPSTDIPAPFSLVSSRGQKGVIVTTDDKYKSKFFTIYVTVYWQEAFKGRTINKSYTVATARTGNR